jgi:hypothetical protein
MERLGSLDLIKLAYENNMKTLLEQYIENAKIDIERMKLDITELKSDALKYT